MQVLFSTMATVSIKMIEAAEMVSSVLSFTPELTFAESPDGMMTFDAQKIPTMGSFANYSPVVKDDSGENEANSNSMVCEVKCRTPFDAIPLAFGKRCSSNKSVPKLDRRTCGAFPLDQQGELDNQVLHADQYRKEKFILYKNIKDGEGDDIVKSSKYYKLMIHYNLYSNDSDQPVFKNPSVGPKGQRSPKEVLMCRPLYGEGFTKGIEGMRVGGIRRIIVHKDLLKNLPKDLTANFKNYAVFDVELVDVCPSPVCCIKATA